MSNSHLYSARYLQARRRLAKLANYVTLLKIMYSLIYITYCRMSVFLIWPVVLRRSGDECFILTLFILSTNSHTTLIRINVETVGDQRAMEVGVWVVIHQTVRMLHCVKTRNGLFRRQHFTLLHFAGCRSFNAGRKHWHQHRCYIERRSINLVGTP